MILPETIDTPRLLLRKPLIEDAAAVFEAYGRDPEVTRFLAWRPHEGVRDSLLMMLSRLACWEAGTEFSWVLTRKANPAVIGMITAIPDRQPWRCSLGYVLARPYWNYGYMTEAVQGVTSLLFQQPGIYRVWAVVDEENHASARVLEKAGMQREGILRGWSLHPNLSTAPRDCWSFSAMRG